MTTPLLSPDQIKSIAGEIRSTEKDRLGTSLPNTTALNAITRALGLGPDFRTFTATYNTKNDAENPVILSELLFVFENTDTDEELLLAPEKSSLIAGFEDRGYFVDFTPGAHGYSSLMLASQRPDITMEQLKIVAAEVLGRIEPLQASDDLPEIKARAVWQSRKHDQMLGVNFRYHENDQVCTANVSENTWRARHQLGLSDEAALLIFGGDCEIGSGYDAGDISVEDVTTSVVYFQE